MISTTLPRVALRDEVARGKDAQVETGDRVKTAECLTTTPTVTLIGEVEKTAEAEKSVDGKTRPTSRCEIVIHFQRKEVGLPITARSQQLLSPNWLALLSPRWPWLDWSVGVFFFLPPAYLFYFNRHFPAF